MTELWNCPDCGTEIDFDARLEHLRDAHDLTYTVPDAICCDDTPCERARRLART